MKGHHLLNLGPQLFKHAFGLLKDSHKTTVQQESAVTVATKHQTSAAVSQTESEDKHPASDSTTSPLLQKEGPHHVLLAPSVYGEVTNLNKTIFTPTPPSLPG